MSDWDELVAQSHDISEFLEKPDINDYLTDYIPEWEDAWDWAPVEDMTEGQILAFIDTLLDIDFEDWPDFDQDYDYWEWFRENYE